MASRRKAPAPKVQFALKPYPLQQEILDALHGKTVAPDGRDYRFLVVAVGRQAGKSWLARYSQIDLAVNHGKSCLWMAPYIPNARAHWNELLKLIDASGVPYERVNRTEKEIYFYGGGSIIVRPAVTADNSRGLTIDYAVLDEAAYFPDGNYVWYDVVQPMLTTTRGKALFLSTPDGMNWFYDQYRKGVEGMPFYKSWTAPSTVNPHQDKELLLELKKSIPERVWRVEYLAEFLASSGGVFNGVDEVLVSDGLTEPEKNATYVMSADFAFDDDGFCITVFDYHSRTQVAGYRWQHVGVEEMVVKLVNAVDKWRPTQLALERNGVGGVFLRILRERLGITSYDKEEFLYNDTKVKAFWMDNNLKRDMVETLVADVEFGNIALLRPASPHYSEYAIQQRSELSVYKRYQNGIGTVRYEAMTGYHDDTVSAAYLANKLLPKKEFIRTFGETKKFESSPFRRGGRLRKSGIVSNTGNELRRKIR